MNRLVTHFKFTFARGIRSKSGYWHHLPSEPGSAHQTSITTYKTILHIGPWPCPTKHTTTQRRRFSRCARILTKRFSFVLRASFVRMFFFCFFISFEKENTLGFGSRNTLSLLDDSTTSQRTTLTLAQSRDGRVHLHKKGGSDHSWRHSWPASDSLVALFILTLFPSKWFQVQEPFLTVQHHSVAPPLEGALSELEMLPELLLHYALSLQCYEMMFYFPVCFGNIFLNAYYYSYEFLN